MAGSSEAPERESGSSTRTIAIAAVLAALLALVVALGLVLRADQGDENEPVTPMRGNSGLPVDGDEAGADHEADTVFAPPWPARRVGGNCSAGGITAHWRVDGDGGWQCTATTPDNPVPVGAPAPPPPAPVEPAPAPAPAPVPVEAPPPPPVYEPPPPPVYEPPVYEPPVYEPAPPPEPEPVPAPAPEPPPPPPPPAIQLPFPLPPILLPPAAAVLP
ncbi:hypothetical protein ACFXK0_28210 [Nocardia sp. NPDC059177]|uniref:hypothetical protein n=1 Tax=Nocardia sp. NPDC059177 TaxID=3346759 RepID=UPI00368D1872